MEHTYCVVMAGGKGERFWPLSTRNAPKPFIKLLGDKTMIQMTIERLLKIVPERRITVVLGNDHVAIAREQLSAWPDIRFLVEPSGRDTAPCIGFTAITLQKDDRKALMVVVPADHFIPDNDGFAKTIRAGVRLAREKDCLVTIGIRPTRPETGYGYIQAGERLPSTAETVCFDVRRFVEKPDAARAARYLAQGGYFWNGGIFVWTVDAVLRGIDLHMAELSTGLACMREALDAGDEQRKNDLFSGFPRISIDYGLMEKADNVVMIEAGFPWDDVGTWGSLQRVLPKDESGNCVYGQAVCIDSKDCVIYSDGVRVGVIGLSDLIVAASGRGVLVCPKGREQETRQIAALTEDDG